MPAEPVYVVDANVRPRRKLFRRRREGEGKLIDDTNDCASET